MQTTVMTTCSSCGEDILSFMPIVQRAHVEYEETAQATPFHGKNPVLMGYSWYHPACAPKDDK